MINLFFFGAPQIHRLPAAVPQHLTPKAMALFAYLAVLPYYQQALAFLQGTTNRILEAFVLVNLGYTSLNSCHYQAAYTYLQQGLALQQLQDRRGRVPPSVHLLNLWIALGVYDAVQPLSVYWTAVRVFTATEDPRASATLHIAYQALQEIARTLLDAPLRRSFLEAVAVNRQLIAAARTLGVTE